VRAVIRSDTSATPPDNVATTAEVVSITGVGVHGEPATATPAGISVFPTTMLTATDPVPEMKKRTVGYAASTQVDGDSADEPAGRSSDQEPSEPVAAYGSLPGTRCAPPLNAH
jgi:hypothetical protein